MGSEPVSRPTDTSDGASPTILYVDDEEHNLTVFEATFEDFYDVRTAESARPVKPSRSSV